MPQSNNDLPSLDALQKKIDSVRNRGKQDTPDQGPENAGLAMRVISELAAGLAVGGVLGYLLDYGLDTLPLFSILCFFLGAAAGFRNIYRAINEETGETKNDAKE